MFFTDLFYRLNEKLSRGCFLPSAEAIGWVVKHQSSSNEYTHVHSLGILK
jgi:hypothetical protein